MKRQTVVRELPRLEGDNKFAIQFAITKKSREDTLTLEELNAFIRDLNGLIDKTFDSSYSTILMVPNLYTEIEDE